MNIYSIRDVRTGFLSPTYDLNDAVAARNFAHAVMNSDSILFTHAADFDLFRIGTFDSETGCLIPEDMPVFVASGKDVLSQ